MIVRRLPGLALVLLISGCASYGVVQNVPSGAAVSTKSYSIKDWIPAGKSSDLSLGLAFSGGGTRAAALSYGVLKALREIDVKIDGQPGRLLNEVDSITSVSGGSFTAAYYGLHGEKIFTDFEGAFLRLN